LLPPERGIVAEIAHCKYPSQRLDTPDGCSPCIQVSVFSDTPIISPFLFLPSHSGVAMKRVTGIGGIFFKAKDAPALQAWYKQHLGIDVQVWGGAAFDWADADGKPVAGTTAWCIHPQDSDHFAPGSAPSW
jgi:hypothetical protein